jgi:HemY protein
MLRLVLFLAGILVATIGLHWLAEHPGDLALNWQGYRVETTFFRGVLLLGALMALTVLSWGLVRRLWRTPGSIGQMVTRRRERRGLDAISSGMIAIGSGDKALATRAAVQARKSLPNEPLTHLLRAQAAQLQGDSATARRIFEAMLASPDTEQLGLRGLYLEAKRVNEDVAAEQFASRALTLNPKLEWPAQSLFDLQCKQKNWDGALETLAAAKKHGHVERKTADRRRAVLLTAQAQSLEDARPDDAMALAAEAHNLAPDLVPAAAIAGRVLAARGQTPKAAKILQRTWKIAPHPDLAAAYAYARAGDSPSDRMTRLRQLAQSAPQSIEGPIAIATTAIENRDWETAKRALEPLTTQKDLTHRIATLMARIEGEGFNNAGKVREWFARSVHAARDPAWTAEGVVSEQWAPVSPVSGRLDAFEWRVPVEALEKPEAALITQRMEDLAKLGATAILPEPTTGRDERPTVEIVRTLRTPPESKPNPDKGKSLEDWLHDDDDAPKSGTNGRGNSGPQPKRLPPTVVPQSAGTQKSEAVAKAPDDPGTEPLDPNRTTSQLERYRLIGAKT